MFVARMAEMYKDILVSCAKGSAIGVTIIGLVLSIFWFWSINILIIIFFYMVLKRPYPSLIKLAMGSKSSPSEMYKDKIKRTKKLIKELENRIHKINLKIRKLRQEQLQLTKIFK